VSSCKQVGFFLREMRRLAAETLRKTNNKSIILTMANAATAAGDCVYNEKELSAQVDGLNDATICDSDDQSYRDAINSKYTVADGLIYWRVSR
jgi:hypothetical protein